MTELCTWQHEGSRGDTFKTKEQMRRASLKHKRLWGSELYITNTIFKCLLKAYQELNETRYLQALCRAKIKVSQII